MSGESSSTYMSMPVPGVGVTAGPTWATDIVTCLTIVDSHDHSTGKGTQITPAGLNINDDLPLAGNDLTQARTVRFSAQGSAIASASPDVRCLYAVNSDLYYNDASGNQIRITSSGSVNAGAGSIGGLPSGTASVTYNGSNTYTFQRATSTPATVDAQNVILRNNAASSYGLTLSPPAAMASDRTITLPNLPASTKIMQLDNTGAVAVTLGVDNSTIEISSNNLIVKDLGISNAKIANTTITAGKLATPVAVSQVFTSSGTLTVAAGVTGNLIITLVGGGGGGGAGGAANVAGVDALGGGGGAGGNAGQVLTITRPATAADTYEVTIGAAGTAGAITGAAGGGGTTGGTTYIRKTSGTTSDYAAAAGGVGGGGGVDAGGTGNGGTGGTYFSTVTWAAATTAGGLGSTGSAGASGAIPGISGGGGAGGKAASHVSGAGGSAFNSIVAGGSGASNNSGGGGGAGGGTVYGKGGAGGNGAVDTTTAPIAGTAAAANTGAGGGGGGGGALGINGLAAANGGAGGSGYVIVTYTVY